jgi:hypothetical protein
MNVGKYVMTVTFSVLLGVGIGFGGSYSGTAAAAATPMSEASAFVSFSQPGFVPGGAEFPLEAKELAWLQTGRFDSIVLLLPANGKNKKHGNQGENEGNSEDHRRGEEHAGKSVSVQAVFGDRDRQVIREYCSQPTSNLPPGLAKRGGQLPPGLEKQLRRNGQLPPGLQKKVQPFPVELERRLPPLPTNYARVCIGGRGLIVDAQFNIVDIIDIFR